MHTFKFYAVHEDILNKNNANTSGYVPCTICKQLVSIIYDHFLTIKNHGPKDEKGNVYYTCPNCMEKSALMLQIEDLHNHIEELNRNISKLTLRNLE